MIQKKKPGVDIVLDVLKATLAAYPESELIRSFLFQYEERGGLSKKQLEGLYSKASKVAIIPEAKLATLQAIILKKHQKHKSELPTHTPLYEKDEASVSTINAILEKYPTHKAVLFYKNKIDKNEVLTALEKTELERFKKVLLKA